MTDQTVQILANAFVVAVSQLVGFLALARKLDTKADKSEVAAVREDVRTLKEAHGGVLQ